MMHTDCRIVKLTVGKYATQDNAAVAADMLRQFAGADSDVPIKTTKASSQLTAHVPNARWNDLRAAFNTFAFGTGRPAAFSLTWKTPELKTLA